MTMLFDGCSAASCPDCGAHHCECAAIGNPYVALWNQAHAETHPDGMACRLRYDELAIEHMQAHS